MSWPLCTIIIPAYNAGAWIERTLQSAGQQTYTNLEVLVVDDGSTDNTRVLAEVFAESDNRFRIIHIANGGVANARNVGIREARGELVAFLDADDLWHPRKIALQVAAMQELVDGVRPGATYTLMRWIDVHDRVTGMGKFLWPSGFVRARHLYLKLVGNGSSIMVPREIALELGGYDPAWAARGIGGCEDLDFELKIAAKYPIVCVPQLLVGYRKSPGNMSSNQLQMARGYVAVVNLHKDSEPQLPGWVKRGVYASTLEYTSLLLMGGRYWREGFQHLLRLFGCDPVRGMKYVLKRLLIYGPRKAGRLLDRSIRRTLRSDSGRGGDSERTGEPLFADLSPEIGPAQYGPGLGRRDQKILMALTEVDAHLWRELRSQQQQSVSETVASSGSSSLRLAPSRKAFLRIPRECHSISPSAAERTGPERHL